MKQSWWRLLPTLLLGYNIKADIDPAVQVTLKSSWQAPSALIEVLYVVLYNSFVGINTNPLTRETVSIENPNAFFPLLDRLTNADQVNLIHPNAPIQIAETNNFLTEPGARELVELNMGLHAATPKIEAFYQHYEDHFNTSRGEQCGSWVDWYGEVVCDLDTLVRLVGTEKMAPM
jgi:UDP-glucose:glycoprotein glucosyltransferase